MSIYTYTLQCLAYLAKHNPQQQHSIIRILHLSFETILHDGWRKVIWFFPTALWGRLTLMEVKCQALTQGSFDIIQLHQPPLPHHSTELNIFWGKDHLLLNTVLSLHSSEICGLCLMTWPNYKCFEIYIIFRMQKHTNNIFRFPSNW